MFLLEYDLSLELNLFIYSDCFPSPLTVYYQLFIRICIFGSQHSFLSRYILKTNFQFWFDMKVVQNFNEIFAPVATVELQKHNLLTKKFAFIK